MKVLVLGHKGMLGHIVVKYLRNQNVNVMTTDIRWPEPPFKVDMRLDYVVNCIGAIPQKANTFDINWQLPIWLDLHAPCNVIHTGTDREDNSPYCISKSIALNYIRQHGKQTKVIQTSVIGPEIQTSASIFEWFLSENHAVVDGYDNVIWTGMTTLEWAKQCYNMICDWDKSPVINTFNTVSSTISKYSLLNNINDVFDKKVKINKITDVKLITQQLRELKEFYYDK